MTCGPRRDREGRVRLGDFLALGNVLDESSLNLEGRLALRAPRHHGSPFHVPRGDNTRRRVVRFDFLFIRFDFLEFLVKCGEPSSRNKAVLDAGVRELLLARCARSGREHVLRCRAFEFAHRARSLSLCFSSCLSWANLRSFRRAMKFAHPASRLPRVLVYMKRSFHRPGTLSQHG